VPSFLHALGAAAPCQDTCKADTGDASLYTQGFRDYRIVDLRLSKDNSVDDCGERSQALAHSKSTPFAGRCGPSATGPNLENCQMQRRR
jgi:hypothetical protein